MVSFVKNRSSKMTAQTFWDSPEGDGPFFSGNKMETKTPAKKARNLPVHPFVMQYGHNTTKFSKIFSH